MSSGIQTDAQWNGRFGIPEINLDVRKVINVSQLLCESSNNSLPLTLKKELNLQQYEL